MNNIAELNKKYSFMEEIYLSKEKCLAHNIDINKAYAFLDDFFAKHHIDKIEQGVWCGDFNSQKQWEGFAHLSELPYTDWFLKVVDKWYGREYDFSEENREDCLKIYYEVKARAAV